MAGSSEPPQPTSQNSNSAPNGTNGKHATSPADTSLANGTVDGDSHENGETAAPGTENVFQLTVQLPHAPGQTQIMVSSQEQVQDIRQSIVDTPYTFQYSCFHLEHQGKRINDFVELSEVPTISTDPVCKLIEDPYTEAQARMHVVRVRELIGAAGNRTDLVSGIDAALSLCDSVELPPAETTNNTTGTKEESSPVSNYDLNAPGDFATLLAPAREPAPKTVKSLSLSHWNPPPSHLRMKGHLLYLVVTTNEGEQFYITSHVSGFFINKSTNHKFDPTPRTSPKDAFAHSLINLLSQVSPSFDTSFQRLQEYNAQRDPLASYQLSNSIPAAPWFVSSSSTQQHQADLTRTQEAFLIGGAENAETLRDWNEEFQSTRELPKESVQDRVFRERLTSKLFAEYNEAAVRGACLVARGEVQPLNPTEARDAQIFVYNNVFYSFGADGVGTFATDGGDEAARVATGKDVQGVKAVNQLDITGLFTPGTVVVDYLGKRVVGQSIVPGIFKQREPGEHQIDYGGVEGKDVIATHPDFAQPFSELSKAMRVKKHAVWDKEHKRHDLEASVETKGLLGTDGRKYVLDLYRVTPLDISWLEKHRSAEGDASDEKKYPHRMTVLRPELVDSFRISRMREYIAKDLEKKRAAKEKPAAPTKAKKVKAKDEEDDDSSSEEDSSEEESSSEEEDEDDDSSDEEDEDEKVDEKKSKAKKVEEKPKPQQEAVDMSGFSFALNPDVFSGQQPQTAAEKAEWEKDEAEVRAACKYLTDDVLPRLIHDLQEGDVGFPMDGQSLVREMHRRGINVRYLGDVARLCIEKDDKRLQALQLLCHQEMAGRAFKHVCNKYLRTLPPCFAQTCVAHLLNCLLGGAINSKPRAEYEDEELKSLFAHQPNVAFDFEKETPASLEAELKQQISLRYRYNIEGDLVQKEKPIQLLREVSLKLGFQLEAKSYVFTKDAHVAAQAVEETKSGDSLTVPQTNGNHHAGGDGGKNKKKKKHADHSPARAAVVAPVRALATFYPENVLNIVPIVKEASPRSMLAEEALDAGRMSIQQDQKELGQELLLESLSLHEQIYGILHPEVARVYYALSTLYYGLEEKAAAVELAKKAVIVSERTLGLDNAETILAYLNLGLFEHANGNTRQALAYVRHALELWKIVYGIRHPDSITTINNAAVMLQTLKLFAESRRWFEMSLEICEEVSGKHSINTATLLFQLAQALALDHDSKAAVVKMRDSWSIFKKELGEENQNTKEAEQWLETLTHSAVNQAKQANALLQNRRILLRNAATAGGRTGVNASAVAGGARPHSLVGQSAGNTSSSPAAMAGATGPGGIDQRNLDELLRYINGSENNSPSSKQKKSGSTPGKKPATHPRRRGAAPSSQKPS